MRLRLLQLLLLRLLRLLLLRLLRLHGIMMHGALNISHGGASAIVPETLEAAPCQSADFRGPEVWGLPRVANHHSSALLHL